MKKERASFAQTNINDMDKFLKVASDLGYKVRTTGGNFITHEISCNYRDFNIIIDLCSE